MLSVDSFLCFCRDPQYSNWNSKNEGILGDVKFAFISLQWSKEFSHVPMWFSVKGTNLKKKKKLSLTMYYL